MKQSIALVSGRLDYRNSLFPSITQKELKDYKQSKILPALLGGDN